MRANQGKGTEGWHVVPRNRRRYPLLDDDRTFTRSEVLRARKAARPAQVVVPHAA